LNDPGFLDRLRRGEESAFKELVESCKDLVYNTALGIVQSEVEAEDVAQEVFVQAFQSMSSFKGESKLSTWLYRITVTKSLDHQRRKKRKKRFGQIRSLFTGEETELAIPDFHHPGVALDQKENAAILFNAISRLPEQQRVAFTLHKVEGLSYKELSEIMNTSVPSVESLMHRAKNNLKKMLEDFYKRQ
jgi:RNA polymerase sigma factor (sigma-70 family)